MAATHLVDPQLDAGGPRAAHDRADALLARAQRCAEPGERQRLRDEAVVLSLGLADQVAQRYRGRGIDLDDLVQVGRMALVKAAHGYQPGRGAGFAAYAVPTIAGEVKRHFRDFGWAVRPPRRLQEVRADLGVQEDLLRHSLLRDPTVAELAVALGLGPDEVARARACSASYRALPLDLPLGAGPRLEVVAQESSAMDRFLDSEVLAHALGRLSARDRRIVHLRFVEEWTQSQIATELGVSQMQVSRLLASILARLRDDLVERPEAA